VTPVEDIERLAPPLLELSGQGLVGRRLHAPSVRTKPERRQALPPP
jgi:hypothetical protein